MNIILNGQQMQQLHHALLDAFPQEATLRQLVRWELDTNLHSVVSSTTLSDMVFELIEWANTTGKLDRLIDGAYNSNADNPRLRAFIAQLPGFRPRGTPGRPEGQAPLGFARWQPLLQDLDQQQCTPILGPALLDPWLGSPREMARLWAERHGFPLAPHSREDLPQVAQFLATVQQGALGVEFYKYLTSQILVRHRQAIPLEKQDSPPDDLLRLAARVRWTTAGDDSYRLLARLPCPIYITANPDTLLAEALRAEGKQPEVELCRWHDDDRWPESVFDRDPGYEPTPTRPLVYHLFGRLSYPFSLVLKEDDYFDYLAGMARHMERVPSAVQAAFADTGLIFLGFQMDDWSFRVLFRSLMRESAAGRRARHAHVAVQLDPQGDYGGDLERVRYYLESYFESAAVTIFWGSVERFLTDLHAHRQAAVVSEAGV